MRFRNLKCYATAGLIVLSCLTHVQAKTPAHIDYGNNPSVAKTVTVNSTKIYYETYGKGKPLVLLHPNGGSIHAMTNVIQEFAKDHHVIAIDSRGQGKSEIGAERLTYEQMAEDTDAVLNQLNIKQAELICWSDGGIVGLILASHHPEKISKMVVMGANTVPEGVEDWAVEFISTLVKRFAFIEQFDPSDTKIKKMTRTTKLMLEEPHIKYSDLQKITAQTLVVAGDRDVIKNSHTVEIFDQMPNSNLAIVPAATHFMIEEDPKRFNQIAREFLDTPFRKPSSRASLHLE